jgi:hypothetical protein
LFGEGGIEDSFHSILLWETAWASENTSEFDIFSK